jgi:hypothetical protein
LSNRCTGSLRFWCRRLTIRNRATLQGRHEGASAAFVKAKIAFLMSWYWGIDACVRIISGFISGYLLERIPKRNIFAFAVRFASAACLSGPMWAC